MIYIETEKVELKRSLNENFEKEVVAFLNSFDGVIYIGVEDNGIICGVNKIDEIMHKISDIISNNIVPNPIEFIEVRLIYESGKYVVEVKVKKGKALYYINKYGRSSKGCYIRVGTSTRSMSEEQIEKTFLSYINIPKFSLLKERSPKQKLTFKIFKIYLDENRIYYNDDNFIENNNLINENEEYNYLAFLLSDQCDISIKIACWEGKNKLSKYLYKKEFGRCCILKALDDLSSYMESTHNKVKSYFDKGKLVRRDEYLFDYISFREAWVNACLHNDYSTHLGPSVYLFNDHMEIFSYGSPLRVQSKEKFLIGTSKPINPELASLFMKLDNAEESGKGINTIVGNYGKDVFKFSETDLTIIIPYNRKVLSDMDEVINCENEEIKCGNEEIKVANEVINCEDEAIKLQNKVINCVNEEIKLQNEVINFEDEEIKCENEEIKLQNEVINCTNEVINIVDEAIKLQNEEIKCESEVIKVANEVINIVDEVINNVNEIIKNVDEEILSLEEKIILIIQKFPDVTILELMEKTGRSKSSIERVLKNSKRIIRVGSRKNGHWEIIE